MDYIPITDTELREMLSAIGVKSLDDLFKDIPVDSLKTALNLPPPLSEPELLKELDAMGRMNATAREYDCYLGAGSYEHFIPSVVKSLSGRAEFVTAYTPYQAEASQGTLQSIYEYQTLICHLTGMDVSNASLYDGGTALAEAALAAYRMKENGGKILVSKTVHPAYRDILKTYTAGIPVEIVEAPYINGVTDIDFIKKSLDDKTLAVLVQSPNFFGCLEPLADIPLFAKDKGALSVVFANPVSLGILEAPAQLGYDIAVGEAQPLGNSMSYGGPYIGYFACTKELLRRMPGRLVGRTTDKEGKTAYTLTLQTREQHIRREKATSNICTNEALNALAACVYLCALGKKGIIELARHNVYLSHYAKNRMVSVKGVEAVFNQPFFNEFAIRADIDEKNLLNNKIIGGLALEKYYPELKNCSLWCVTETKTKAQIDRLTEVLSK